jgi:alpha,alpha-trehalase
MNAMSDDYAHGMDPSPFPPIGDYGFLSDGEVTALVALDGTIEWLCLPRPDSPSVFGSILDRAAGGFNLSAAATDVPAARRYLPGTLVLETTWQTGTGWIVVRDALLVGPWPELDHGLEGYRRPPTDFAAEHVLLRTVRCINGRVDMEMSCEPVFGYGLVDGRWDYDDSDYHGAVVCGDEGDPVLRLSTDLRLGFEGRSAQAHTTMREGDEAFVAFVWGEGSVPRTSDEARERMRRTGDHWRRWLTLGRFPDHPWRMHLQRSALTLKALTYAPTGALLAAPTTSLPEQPGGARNWDYRYSWVRDSTFALWGLYTLGFDFEADGFFNFIADVCVQGALQVMYGVGGERTLTERTLDHLSGYRHSRPVRIGNAAFEQIQLDVWGALLDSVYLHVPLARTALRALVEAGRRSGRSCDRQLDVAGPGNLGGSRRAEALHVVEDHVLGRLRPRRSLGRASRRARSGCPVACGRGGDPVRRAGSRCRRTRRVDAIVRVVGAGCVPAPRAARPFPPA